MTLPAFKAIGSGSTGNPSWPAGHAAGDFALLCIEHQLTGSVVTTPSGWSLVRRNEYPNGTTILSVFSRFATSGSETAPTISGPTNHTWSVISTYSGVNTDTPIHGACPSWAANNSAGLPGITTYVDDCLIAQIVAWSAASVGPLTSGESNSTLGSLTKRFDAGTLAGNGGGLVIYDGTLATHGTFDITSFTCGTATNFACLTLALQAADKNLPILQRKSRVINGGM
jgi:hypothetical protein